MRAPRKLRILRSSRVAPIAALVFIVLVLLIFNLSSWRMFKLLQDSKEQDLTRRLRSTTQVVTHALGHPEPPDILQDLIDQPAENRTALLETYPEQPEYEELTNYISQLKIGSGLAQILVLSPTGTVITDSNYRFLTGDPLPFAIDSQFLAEALQTGHSRTPLYAWEGEHFLRDYQVMRAADGTPTGVVMCSISADYVESMNALRKAVLRLGLISSATLLLLGIWLYRLFRYVEKLERQTLQHVRVEAMGSLAGGLAHEIRNPLAIIRALTEEIQADQPDSPRTQQNAQDIITETQRLSDLVTHFLSLSHSPGAADRQSVDLAEETERVVQLMQKSAPDTLKFTLATPSAPVHVKGDDRALRQVLLNLLVNAREAIGANPGEIRVRLTTNRGQAELSITDNGTGIAPKDLSRIFEPFYTTRSNGTGLGLSICKSIIENLEGQLHVQSQTGHGTTATVVLPLGTGENA